MSLLKSKTQSDNTLKTEKDIWQVGQASNYHPVMVSAGVVTNRETDQDIQRYCESMLHVM